MILSDKVLEQRLVTDPSEVLKARQWWEDRDWAKIADRILIDPFDKNKLGLCDYSFCVGEQYIFLQDPFNTRPLDKDQQIVLGPGETALILTEEYVALPRNIMGFVVPRARRLFEGSSICASRIDPTWYGKLIIGFTNLAKFPVVLYRGEPFCIFYMVETRETEKVLTKREMPHLGRTSMGKMEFPDLRPKELVRPEDVSETHIKEVIDSFGRPYDIVFGAIEQNRVATYEAVERELGPKLAETAASQAVHAAFREQQRWLRNLIIGILAIIGLPVVTVVVTWILRLVGLIP